MTWEGTGTDVGAGSAYGYVRTQKALALAGLAYLGFPTGDSDILVTGDSYAVYTQALNWVTQACQDVADFAPWYWLEKSFQDLAFTADAYAIDAPADCRRLLTDPSYQDYECIFEPASLNQIQQLRAFDTASGIARVFALTWNATTKLPQVIMWPPVADATTFKIAYTRSLPLMTTPASDQPNMPAEFHEYVEIGVLAMAEERFNHNFDSQPRKQLYARLQRQWEKWQQTPGPLRLRMHNHGNWLTGRALRNDITASHPDA